MKLRPIDKIKVDIKTIEDIQKKALHITHDSSIKLDSLSVYFRDVFSIIESDIARVIENNTEFKYYKAAYKDAFDRLRSYNWTSYWTPHDQRELLHRIESYVKTEGIMLIKRMEGYGECFYGIQNSCTKSRMVVNGKKTKTFLVVHGKRHYEFQAHSKSYYEYLTMALNCLEKINNKVEKGKLNENSAILGTK